MSSFETEESVINCGEPIMVLDLTAFPELYAAAQQRARELNATAEGRASFTLQDAAQYILKCAYDPSYPRYIPPVA